MRHCYAAPSVELPICVAVRYLILRTGCEKHGRKNPLPYLISERSHIGNLRQIRKQGKGRSSKRKGNRRCPFLFAPPRGAARSRRPQTANPPAEVQRKTPCPLGANTLTQFAHPRLGRCRKGAALLGRTCLRQFVCPGQPVLKKLPPGQGEPPARFRCPNRPVQRKRVPHADTCPSVKTKYFYALHYKSDVL